MADADSPSLQMIGAVAVGSFSRNEPPHDKTHKMTVRLAKTQISLGIHPVWSVFAVRSMGS